MKEVSTVLVLAFSASLSLFPRVQEQSSRVEQYLISQMHESGFSGEVLVAEGDELLIKKRFQASSNLSSDLSQPEDRFPAGSIAEQFMAAAILQLELAGQVKLDSPICDYISGCPDDWKQMQVLHLLTHSSGLPSLDHVSCVEHAASTSSTVMAMLRAKPLLFEPGKRFNLNSLDYFFLSLVIEKISGQLTSEYLVQHIFHPLKLAQTGYLGSAWQKKNTGTQTQAGCSQGELPANLLLSSFSGQLYTSISDLYRWNHALSTGKFLPKNSLDQMYTAYIEGHGFGWKILKEFDRKVAVQNDESDSGSGSVSVSIRIYPDDDTCIIVVSQVHEAAASGLGHEVGALLFGRHSRISSNPGAAHH
jgi:CubicO group peptidase (beta-lactamase class C family)